MTKREKYFCYDLAKFMCFPDAFEIGGGLSSTLRDIIRNMTNKNKVLRKEVLEICEDFVYSDEYDRDTYGEDKRHALKQIREDYDCVFY